MLTDYVVAALTITSQLWPHSYSLRVTHGPGRADALDRTPVVELAMSWYSDGLRACWVCAKLGAWAAARYHSITQGVIMSVKQARDRAQYVRNQRGHSLVLHLALGWVALYVPTIYFAFSPNHYFHA